MRAGVKSLNRWVWLLLTLQLVLPLAGRTEGLKPLPGNVALEDLPSGYALVAGRDIRLSQDHRFVMFRVGNMTRTWPLILSHSGRKKKVDAGLYCAIENLSLVDQVIPKGHRFNIARMIRETFPNPEINRVSFVVDTPATNIAIYCSIDDGSQPEAISCAQFLSTVGPYFTLLADF